MRHGRQTIDLPLAAQRLVAFLALHDRPLQRRYIAARLWIDVATDRANANLRTAVWRLQRTGVPIVESTASQLALHRGVEVDAREANRLALDVLDGPHVIVPSRWRMLTLDLVPDWYDQWIDEERDCFRQLRLHALEELAMQLIAAGRVGEAVHVALTAASGDPTRESAHRTVISAYLAEGNVAEAVRHYDRFQRAMMRELGVSPSPDLAELVRSALHGPSRGPVANGDHRRRSEKLYP